MSISFCISQLYQTIYTRNSKADLTTSGAVAAYADGEAEISGYSHRLGVLVEARRYLWPVASN